MNKLIKEELYALGWGIQKYNFVLTKDEYLTAEMINKMPFKDQKTYLDKKQKILWRSTKADFKDRVSIEVQFGKYSFVQYDMFVKHLKELCIIELT